MESSPAKQKLTSSPLFLGLVCAVLGSVAWGLEWQTALAKGTYGPVSSVAMPILTFLGLAAMIAPTRRKTPDAPPPKFGVLRARLAVVLAGLGIVVGFLNLALISGRL